MHILLLALLAAIVSAVLFWPVKSNREYLVELIETSALVRTAHQLAVRLRESPGWCDVSSLEWQRIEDGLRSCLEAQADRYVASDDPYLNQRANSETPTILANRFLNACGL